MASISRHALDQIIGAGLTRAEYVAEFSDDMWHGDRCGCPDDRCIGHHHENQHDCSCLRAVLDGIVWDRLVAVALRSSSYLRQLNDAQLLTSAAYYSALSADSAANGPWWVRTFEPPFVTEARADMMVARTDYDVALRDSCGLVR